MTEHTPERPTIIPDEPTAEELAATTERRRRELAEQQARDARAEADLTARSKETAAAVLARIERLKGVGDAEVSAAEERAWTNLSEHRRKVVFPEDFRRDLIAEKMMHLAGFTLAGVQDRLAADLLRGYLDSGYRTHPTLILNGGTGAGKTTALNLVCRTFLERGHHVRVTSQRDFLETQRPGRGNRDNVAAERYAARLANAEVLGFDDLGMDLPEGETVTPFVLGTIKALLADRAERGLITVVTTNLSADVLERMFDSRFISRLGLNAFAIEMTGPDMRKPTRW